MVLAPKEEFLTKVDKENKSYIIKYSIVLISISLILAIIGIIDYHLELTSNNSELLVFLYGINWFVLSLNILYWINVGQRNDVFKKIKLIFKL